MHRFGAREGSESISLGPTLDALGLELWVVVNPAKLEKMRPRLAPSRWPEKRRKLYAANI